MKIIFAHNPPDLYGASRSLLRLTSRLVKDGHEIYVLLPNYGELGSELLKHGVRVIEHPRMAYISREKFKDPLALLKILIHLPISVMQLRRLIKKNQPDIIHTNTSLIISSALAAYLTKKKHIWHVRETFSEFGLIWKFYRRFISYFSSKIICVSQAVADQFQSSTKIEIINNGFSEDEFKPVSMDRLLKFKNDFSLDSKVLVGVVGRIKLGRKGQDVFVKAAAILKDKEPDLHFLIIGSPFPGNEDHLIRLQNMIKEFGLQDFVTITGDVEDIKAAISALDISVLPSAFPEPFGGVVIESMAFSKPVIGTNVGGTTEQINDGITGYLINPNDQNELADSIIKLVHDKSLRINMGIEGRKKFLEKFEFEKFYTTINKLYCSLLKKT